MNDDEKAARGTQLLKDYKDTFGTPHGKRVLADLQKFCNVGLSVPGISNDDLRFIEGMRAVFWRCFYKITQERPPSARSKTPPPVDFDAFQSLQRTHMQ